MILRYGWTGRGTALSSMAKSWSRKMKSFRLTIRKLLVKTTRITGSRRIGGIRRTWVRNWSVRASGMLVATARGIALDTPWLRGV